MSKSITPLIETLQSWNNEKQLAYCETVLFQIPLSIRGIWSDDYTTAENKLDAIKWLNEFTHRAQNVILDFKRSSNNNLISNLFENIAFYVTQNSITKAELNGIINLAFKKTQQIPTKTFKDYTTEYLVFQQALNEVCHGAYAIEEWEFGTLMGITKPKAVRILNTEKDLWQNRYQLLKNNNSSSKEINKFTLQKFGQDIPENQEVVFTFEAKNYNEAMCIRNTFLGFEPYVPLPENRVAERQYTIVDKKNSKIGFANVTIYQPIKMSEGQWVCNYQITGIGNDEIYGIIGVDGIQAIQLSYSIIDGLLCNYNQDNET